MKTKKIIFTGGGSGGHIFPLISVVRELKENFPKDYKLEIFYIAPKDDIPSLNLTKEGLKVKYIFAGKIRRYLDPISIILNIIDLIKIPLGTIQATYHLFKISPDLIFSKGGYGSIPVAIAGAIFQIPIILHESDAVPGLSNKIVSKFATEIFVSFEDTVGITPAKKFVIGQPIRKEILNGKMEESIKRFNITKEKPVLLILGGSQGSEKINNAILTILIPLLENFEVIHQCGKNNFDKINKETDEILSFYLKKYYHLFPFLSEEELRDAYKVSSLVISRAGGTLFEILANGKPSILIPHPTSAQNHQAENSYRMEKFGASVIMEENNLTPHFFLDRVKAIFLTPNKLSEMEKNAKYFAKPKAGYVLAAYLKEFLIR